jgi:molybdopterin-guanine dinucleotide biosynthesis protein A
MGGADKAFLRFRGVPLWRHQLATLAALGPGQLLISANADQEFPPAEGALEPGGAGEGVVAEVVRDREPDLGPLGGLAAALEACRRPVALVLAIDLPLLTPGWIAGHLLAPVAKSGWESGVVPWRDGRFEPLGACYPASLHALARDLLAGGERSLQAFAEAALLGGAVEKLVLDPAGCGLYFNLNSPADLAALETRAKPADQP